MAQDGLFINIEGPDASGKETQWNLLVGKLQEKGHEVYKQDFPAYDRTDAGQQLHEYLHSEGDLPLQEEAQLFIEDRRALKDEIKSALNEGKVVVTDRYSQSNYAYQTTGMASSDRWEFIEWMKQEEQDLPQPDVTLYIDMPVEQSLVLLENRETRDKNENREKLEQVVYAYREIAEKEDWEVVRPMKEEWYAMPEDERPEISGTSWLRSKEDIFDAGDDAERDSVWQKVEPYIPDN